MAYDEKLAERVRSALSTQPEVVEKAMFGGLAFMVAGNMCCGVHHNDLIVRLAADTTVGDLGSPDARPWDLMKRPMPGMFAIDAAGCANQKTIAKGVGLALKHALSLPPKVKSQAKKRILRH
jgi:TfoX/Sxy family transcriptional regulator of competence genes